MSKWKDVVATVRYTDKTGAEKKRYVNCGAAFDSDKGINLKIDNLPVGWDGWLSLYDPKPKDGAAPEPKANVDEDGERIPF